MTLPEKYSELEIMKIVSGGISVVSKDGMLVTGYVLGKETLLKTSISIQK